MALRQLILSKKIEAKRAALAALDEAKQALETRRAQLNTREAEIEAAVNEVTDQTPEEERQTVEAEAEQFEQDAEALTREEAEHEQQRSAIEQEIADLRSELEEINKRAQQLPAHEHVPETDQRKDEIIMENRTTFYGMSYQQRDALFAREDIKNWVQRIRQMGIEQRNIEGKELLIPDVFMGIIRNETYKASKLIKHVNHKKIGGNGNVIVSGTVPRAVWTDMCAKINEMTMGFYGEDIAGWKVAGYIAVCKAALEDSDINLATEIIDSISAALGYELDMAICYGTGTKMPLGIVTRLLQTEEPSNYSAKARPWENLSATNVQAITSKNGLELFKAVKTAMSAAKGKMAKGQRFWAMNESTKTTLEIEAMSLTASGAFATGMTGATMPNPLGGTIETLEFIPDGIVIGGYGELYYLAERAGVEIGISKEVRFLEDEIVYKGTARYDGKPIIAEGFVAFGINGKKPTAADVTFAPDKANGAD